jgi:hypothetical protein
VHVDPGDQSVHEGNSGTTPVTFHVSLDKAATDTTTVTCSTADGTATAASGDYQSKTATVTFAAGQKGPTDISFLINGDTTPEQDETFFVDCSVSGPATMDPGAVQKTITIQNDDGPVPPGPKVHVDPGDQSVKEGNSGTTAVTYNISLDSPATGTTVVSYSTADGTATAASGDYQAKTGSVTFTAGQKGPIAITVLINGDTTVEPDETFYLHFGVSGPASIDPPQTSKTITIQNDDK